MGSSSTKTQDKAGLSSQYKIRRANRENKVLASKQNLNNESEEGT